MLPLLLQNESEQFFRRTIFHLLFTPSLTLELITLINRLLGEIFRLLAVCNCVFSLVMLFLWGHLYRIWHNSFKCLICCNLLQDFSALPSTAFSLSFQVTSIVSSSMCKGQERYCCWFKYRFSGQALGDSDWRSEVASVNDYFKRPLRDSDTCVVLATPC